MLKKNIRKILKNKLKYKGELMKLHGDESKITKCQEGIVKKYIEDSFLLSDNSIDGNTAYSLILKKINETIYNNIEVEKVNISESFNLSIKTIHSQDFIKDYLNNFGKVLTLNDQYVFIEYTGDDCFGYLLLGLSSSNFSNIFPTIFAESLDDVYKVLENFKKSLSLVLKKEDTPQINVHWYTMIDGRSDSYYSNEYLDDIFHTECYPDIDIHNIISDYLDSNVPVLFMLGPPGTGKTRLIREILKRMYHKKKDEITCLYTSSREIIESGSVYLNLIFNDIDVLVLEDIDYHITPRKEGNTSMYNLLSVSNGILANTIKNKKIILSSNLPHKHNIDEALLRPGRCHSILETRRLNKEEAEIVCKKIGKEMNQSLLSLKSYSLADLYNS
jgi:SpoVK/Ycf46/Vps4 family AAA+-type ATPase